MKPLRSDEPGHPPLQPLSVGVLVGLVAAKLAIHLPLLGRFGYFRDELYFLDCARHLDWGYVDHAPLVAVYAKVALLLGGSLPALRLIPALAGAALVALAVLLARELGGGRVAQAAAGVAAVVRALPPEDRARACIFANNYGEAGALNLFGPALGLPPVISGHQTHFLWGPGRCSGEVLVVTQDDRESLERSCTAVVEAGHHEHPWGMAEENGAIWVCRGLRLPLSEAWPRVKHWN
jgi:hypothetical protein